MSAERAPSANRRTARSDVDRYFDHRTATTPSPEMLVLEGLEIVWINAAALGMAARNGPVALVENRLVLAPRRKEDSLRAFLASLDDACGAWCLHGPEDRWLVRVEPVSPPDMARAWLLKWQPMDDPARYLWSDIGESLSLTPSETRLLRRLLDGRSVDETATALSISVQTARTHVRRIYAKLNVSNREQLFAAVLPFRLG